MGNSSNKKFLSPLEVIQEGYASSLQTLANMRVQKRGPRYFKPNGGGIRYSRDDLEKWVRDGVRETEDSIRMNNY